MSTERFLPPVRSIKRDDIPGAPSWVEPLLDYLNRLTNYLYIAFDGGINIGGNVQGFVKDIDVRTQSDYTSGEFDIIKFKVDLGTVTSVTPLQVIDQSVPDAVLAGPVWIDWRATGGLISIRWVSGLEASRRYSMKVHVF